MTDGAVAASHLTESSPAAGSPLPCPPWKAGKRQVTGCTDCSGDQGLFEDLQLGYWTSQTYWGGQDGAFYFGLWRPSAYAGLFQTTVGSATWAVRAGAPVQVPEPASFLLVAGALGALALVRRRRPASRGG